ncbi:MAG: DNA polymerase III subunit delta [Tannerellaceae bacterium]|nr:DNA polymerase III subunit delta [Tannerellaceae bacterium]
MAKKEDISFEAICRDIKKRNFAPVYILMGEEPYFIDRITNLLMDSVLNETEKDFNQIILYGADTDAAQILNAARRFPMMAEYQLVVVREAQQIRNIDQLSHYVKNPLQSTILVINYKYKTLDRRKALAAAAEKNGIVFESKKVPDYKMAGFVTSMLQERSVTIEPKAVQMLSDFLGNDLNRLVKELDKLIILLPENGLKRITPDLVEENIGISKEYNNYELIKALVLKDVLKSNRIIQYFEKNPKNNPIQATLPVIFNYFSNLLIAFYSKDRSENGLMTALGFRSPYQVKDYLAGLRNFSAMKVFTLISEIRQTDARAKGVENSSVSDAELLKELVYKILH